jgi:hypothetical protein
MKVIISESRLMDVAVSWLGSTFGNATPIEWSGIYPDWEFYTQDDEIIFSWSDKDKKVIVHGSQIGYQLMQMFDFDYEQNKNVVRKWLNKYYGIDPKTMYFGSFNHIDFQ